MIIEEVSAGQKAVHELNFNANGEPELTVSVGDQSVTVNLAEKEQDVESLVDISLGGDRTLIEGIGRWYVATIIIPPRSYHMVDSGQVNENEEPIMIPEADPVNTDNVKLCLWGLPAATVPTEGGSL